MPMEAILIAIGAAIWKLVKELPEIFAGRNKEPARGSQICREISKTGRQAAPALTFCRREGISSLAGNRAVSADAVKYVLSIEERPRLLRDYVAGRAYLELSAIDRRARLAFTKKYK